MAHDATVQRSESPALSGRASPNLRAGRKVEEDVLQKGDKAHRRYAAGIDKALSTFESSHQDWADYIAFLGRLLKAIQAVKETTVIPHSQLVSLRLAQCLHPALPSGVHQKALEVYAHIFELLQSSNLGRDLQVFLPGLLPVLSFASLTVRPLFYNIFEDHVEKLDRSSLRSPLKSMILALLPGIEDETSEDFERGISVLDRLRLLASANTDASEQDGDWAGYFWQCFFLAVMTGETRRQGALAYLSRRLPPFKAARRRSTAESNGHADKSALSKWSTGEAEMTITPEPGLLVRCFAAGLRDQNILVQRGFLDLLVTHIPLDSEFLQQRIQESELDLIVGAAVTVVLRRDMSLNRRLWAWFLGPEATAGGDEAEDAPFGEATDGSFSKQAIYFQKTGAASLQRCLLKLFSEDTSSTSDKVRPFRISSALMDRWEIGGYLLPYILVPGLRAAFEYNETLDKKGADEVIRSASLFFDGIESSLIWSQIIGQLSSTFDLLPTDPQNAERTIRFLIFVVTRFNIREEDMLAIHVPRALLVTLYGLATTPTLSVVQSPMLALLELAQSLISALPEFSGQKEPTINLALSLSKLSVYCTKEVETIKKASRNMNTSLVDPHETDAPVRIQSHLISSACSLYKRCLNDPHLKRHANRSVEILIDLLDRSGEWTGLDIDGLFSAMSSSLQIASESWKTAEHDFALAVSIARLWTTLSEQKQVINYVNNDTAYGIENHMVTYLWLHLAASNSKHHVDAVRLLWAIRRSSRSHEHSVNVSIFVTERLVGTNAQLEDFERFMTLWGHTIQKQQARPDRKPSLNARRASNLNAPMEITLSEAEDVLGRPLMIVLDTLSAGGSDISAVIAAWLRTLPSLDRVLSLLTTQLEQGLGSIEEQSVHIHNSVRRGRSDQQYIQNVDVSLDRLLALLAHSSSYTWSILAEARQDDNIEARHFQMGTQHLAELAVKLILNIDCAAYESTHRRILRLLDVLLTCSHAPSLKALQIELPLLQLLEKAVRSSQGSLQVELLRVLPHALKIKESVDIHSDESQRSRSIDDVFAPVDQQIRMQTGDSRTPPPTLLDCIKDAIKTPSSRIYLEYWIRLLNDVLPLYSQAIVSAMIPLVECFCTQINQTFEGVKKMATQSMAPQEQIPTSTLFELLHGLELILANAHRSLDPIRPEPVTLTALSPTAQSFFGGPAATPSAGDPSKTAKSNSRLTVIICVHDAVEICYKMWFWASYGVDASDIDAASSATAAFNSQKIRSRTKKMLEHMFTAEGLESVETLAAIWAKSKNSGPPDDGVFSLINALAASRPRIAMPLILNALYSRTNIDALESGRRSTLTCDLTAIDLAAFLLKYVSTTEDDALDEIWTDCNAFMRDVLLNPMPHRQVLPLYLELTTLLAEKVDNTNFGERQRIHRELADFFSRLLSATFTTRPNTGPYDVTAKSNKTGDQTGDLLSSLITVTPKLQIVLETTDRILIAVNSITTHAISSSFHARTFPENVRPDLLRLIGLIAVQNPDAKLWKREVGEAFSDARIFGATPEAMSSHWFPVLKRWSAAEKTVVADTLSRIVAPSAAALMFGVGANSARLAADRTAQHNLRRTALLLLANDQDGLSSSVPLIDNKTAELCTATLTSAPSCATRADVFMLWRALFLSTSHIHLAGMWPTINATLQSALLSACPPGPEQETYNNLSLLQACKLLDMLATIQPDDFQLQEWIFLTNTIDAVYASDTQPTSLVDEVAAALTATGLSNGAETEGVPNDRMTSTTQKLRQPLLARLNVDTGDVKAMAREDFTKQILLPFFNGLGVAAYEGTYQMNGVDWDACRKDLIEDLMDEGTVV